MVSAPALSSVSVMASVDLSVCCGSRGKMGLMSPMYAVNELVFPFLKSC